MPTFVCAARFAPGDEAGVVATLPDVAQAITQGDDEAAAIRQAEEASAPALAPYPRRHRPVAHAQAVKIATLRTLGRQRVIGAPQAA